ncbi:hypothetical protein D3C80_1776970 [compost metagenome]
MAEVVGQAADHDLVGLERDGTAAERTKPRHQLLDRKRLGEIVVGAAIETGDTIVDGAERRQHHDRRFDAQGAQLRNEAQAFAVGQATIEHDHVVGPELDHSLGIGERRNMIDDHLSALEGGLQGRCHFGLVL